MAVPILNAAERTLPIIIGGMGPAGAATAIGLRRAGERVLAFEARGDVANRARSIAVRPQTREIFHDMTGRTLGQNAAIMDIENPLRRAAESAGTETSYHSRIVGVRELEDRVQITVEDARSGARSIVEGRAFVDASGGRIEATNSGMFERVPTSDSHVYITAQYRTPAKFSQMSGVYDQRRQELLALMPIGERSDGFIAYLDLKPGVGMPSKEAEAAALDRYARIAENMGFGEPMSPPSLFDARQHVSRTAASARIIKIGDSVGNADPYIGAGIAAALVDAKHAAAGLTGTKGTLEQRLAHAAEDARTGHRLLGIQSQAIVDMRHTAWSISAKNVPLEQARMSDVRPMLLADRLAHALTQRPVFDGTRHTYTAYLETAGAKVAGLAGGALGAAQVHASNAAAVLRSPWRFLTGGSD